MSTTVTAYSTNPADYLNGTYATSESSDDQTVQELIELIEQLLAQLSGQNFGWSPYNAGGGGGPQSSPPASAMPPAPCNDC